MIAEVQARVASIEARIGVRSSPPVTLPERAEQPRSLELASAGHHGLAHQTSFRPGTLGAMWASALDDAAPNGLGGPQPVAPYHGPVPSGASTYRAAFEAAGRRYGIDPDLLAAVAWTESNFNADAVSHAGAIGLMQIMPGTAAGLGVDPRDPVQAIDGAARYLRQQLDRFGDVRLALAAYNAGPGAVERHGGIPPYDETMAYVPKVLGRYETLRSSS